VKYGKKEMILRKIKFNIIGIILTAIIFIFVTFLVSWLTEDIIYFSLFIGISAGIISSIIFLILWNCITNNKWFAKNHL
jgi:hypothetical protein